MTQNVDNILIEPTHFVVDSGHESWYYIYRHKPWHLKGGMKVITKMLDKTAIAQNLRTLRMEKGKTVAQVSSETGLGETALRNYECGIRIPRYIAMFTLADYYGKSVDDIFFSTR